MPAMPRRRSMLAALVGLITLAGALTSRGRDAGNQPAQPLAQPRIGPAPGVYPASHCESCHNQDRSHVYPKSLRDRMICGMNEWQYYDQNDKHQIAFRSLKSPRSQIMVQQLGYRDRKASEVEACLACHAVRAAGNVRVNPETLAEGVTCVACHGPYLDWVRIHPESILLGGRADSNRPNAGRIGWIDLSREEKANQFGMTDLRDPVRRAETCASCHVGNHDQGKVVTHAMYAAGHPPLPGFETAAFSEAQPPHWQKFDKRSPERQSRFKAHDPRNLEQTQLVAVSGLVVLREWMKLFAGQAAVENPDPAGAPWPDFARFDCYACHHELQARDVVSWRQLRRRDSQPGRPAPPDWPLILVQLGIDLADPKLAGAEKTQFEQHLAEFRDSMKVRPFGDSESSAAARQTAAWADYLLKSVSHTIVDAAKARQLLDRLCAMAQDRVSDYDSARQIAWAFRVIYHESTPKENRDRAVDDALSDLEASLALDLPPTKQQVPIERTLQDRLRVVAGFDPAIFQARFAMIAERLKRPVAVPPAGR